MLHTVFVEGQNPQRDGRDTRFPMPFGKTANLQARTSGSPSQIKNIPVEFHQVMFATGAGAPNAGGGE